MWRTEPLLSETAHGLLGHGRAQLDYLLYLALQAVVVFAWWPKSSLREMLAAGDGPDTLLAAMVAAGFAIAWYSVRAGAEEVLLPGQHGLREWAAATTLPLARVLGGYLASQALHTLHLIALSAPLLLVAFSVSGGEWDALGWCLAAIVFQATFYRLAGACIYLFIGQFGAMTILSVRGFVILAFVASAVFVPAASFLRLCAQLLGNTGSPAATAPQAPLSFIAIHAVLAAALVVLVRWQLARVRGVVHAGAARA